MRKPKFTLVELMIAIAILAVVVGIAIPAYNGFVESRINAAAGQYRTLRIALEDYWLDDNGTCGVGSGGVDPAASTLTTAWPGSRIRATRICSTTASPPPPTPTPSRSPTYWPQPQVFNKVLP